MGKRYVVTLVGEERAELDHDLEGGDRVALEPEKVREEDEVPGRRNGEVLGQPFDDAEEKRRKGPHCRRRFYHGFPRVRGSSALR